MPDLNPSRILWTASVIAGVLVGTTLWAVLFAVSRLLEAVL